MRRQLLLLAVFRFCVGEQLQRRQRFEPVLVQIVGSAVFFFRIDCASFHAGGVNMAAAIDGAHVDQQIGDSGSSVLKLAIVVRASEVQVNLTVDKLDAPSGALGNTLGEMLERPVGAQ